LDNIPSKAEQYEVLTSDFSAGRWSKDFTIPAKNAFPRVTKPGQRKQKYTESGPFLGWRAMSVSILQSDTGD